MSSMPVAQLRLFSPLETQPLDYLDLTLRQAFNAIAKPTMLNAKRSTLEVYENVLNRWEEYTNDPKIIEICDMICDSFTQSVMDRGSVKPTTYNKWARHLRGIFNRLGPRDSRNKLGKGVLPQIPIIQTLNEELEEPTVIPLDHISAMYDACDVAKYPNRRGVAPPVRWRALLTLLYFSGPRRFDAVSLGPDAIQPNDQLRWIAQKTRKKQCVPLHPIVKAHLALLPDDDPLLLGFTPGNRMAFYTNWHSICDAAGVPRYTPKDFRKTCATQLDLQFEGAAGWVLGHAHTVTRKYYINPAEKIRRAVLNMDVPESFKRILDAPQL